MLIYENRQDVIDNIRAHIERQLDVATRAADRGSPRSHAAIAAQGRVSALKGVQFYLTDYTYRNELEPEAVASIMDGA